jgi:hypothetical protein
VSPQCRSRPPTDARGYGYCARSGLKAAARPGRQVRFIASSFTTSIARMAGGAGAVAVGTVAAPFHNPAAATAALLAQLVALATLITRSMGPPPAHTPEVSVFMKGSCAGRVRQG